MAVGSKLDGEDASQTSRHRSVCVAKPLPAVPLPRPLFPLSVPCVMEPVPKRRSEKQARISSERNSLCLFLSFLSFSVFLCFVSLSVLFFVVSLCFSLLMA